MPRKLKTVFAGLILAMVLAALDQSIVNTALPRMASDLGGLNHLSWVVTAFMLVSSVATPLYGKFSDMYGRRRLFGISISVFLIGSMLCGLSQTMWQLIGFRALQGLGAGGLMVLSQTVIADMVSPRERGRYQGLFTGAMSVASVSGPLIGGGLTQALSWRWVFYVNLPLGLLALALIMAGVPKRIGAQVSHKIDVAGAVLLAIAATSALLLVSLAGSTIPWVSPQALALGAIALGGGALFLRQESRAQEPIIRLSLFKIPAFAIGVAATGCMGFAMMGAVTFLPLYFQLVLGMQPAATGLMMLPQIGMMLISSVIGGQLTSRYGKIKPFLVGGVVLEVVGLAGIGIAANMGWPAWSFLFSLGVLGLGMGVAMPNATVVVQNAAPGGSMGVATASLAFVRSLGAVTGVAVSGGLIGMRLKAGLAHLAGVVDVKALMEGGAARVSSLPPEVHAEVADVYRHAIAGCFLSGALVMFAALILVSRVKVTLQPRPAPQTAAA
jgi:EmrB/QacA subfamily drug resistance transporter